MLAANPVSRVHNNQPKHGWNPTKILLPGGEEGEQRGSASEHLHTCVCATPPPAAPPPRLAGGDVTEADIPASRASSGAPQGGLVAWAPLLLQNLSGPRSKLRVDAMTRWSRTAPGRRPAGSGEPPCGTAQSPTSWTWRAAFAGVSLPPWKSEMPPQGDSTELFPPYACEAWTLLLRKRVGKS